MNRRGFLSGILGAACAPAICRAELLMPVKVLWLPNPAAPIATGANSLLTIEMITAEAIRLFVRSNNELKRLGITPYGEFA